MLGKFKSISQLGENGAPTGGTVSGPGLEIKWQDGPLGRDGDRSEPNGAFVETLIEVAKQRIDFYQKNNFSCKENACAITKLEEALHWLNARTSRREEEGVEGTHEGS